MKYIRSIVFILIAITGFCMIPGCSENTISSESVDPFSEELATDELVLYCWDSDFNSKHDFASGLSSYIRSFSRNHPNVAVELKTFDRSMYADMLTVELMAGKGPDLVFWENTHSQLLPDINKTIEANAFLDLSPYFEQDPDFDFAAYSPAIDAGLLNGKRYYVPVSYLLQSFISTEDIIERYEFDWSVLDTYG